MEFSLVHLQRGRRLVSGPQIQAVHGGMKFRAVGKYLYPRPLRESFYDWNGDRLLSVLCVWRPVSIESAANFPTYQSSTNRETSSVLDVGEVPASLRADG